MTWLGHRETVYSLRREAETETYTGLPEWVLYRCKCHDRLMRLAETPTPSPWDLRRWRVEVRTNTTAERWGAVAHERSLSGPRVGPPTPRPNGLLRDRYPTR